jgi:hypothetical protein
MLDAAVLRDQAKLQRRGSDIDAECLFSHRSVRTRKNADPHHENRRSYNARLPPSSTGLEFADKGTGTGGRVRSAVLAAIRG